MVSSRKRISYHGRPRKVNKKFKNKNKVTISRELYEKEKKLKKIEKIMNNFQSKIDNISNVIESRKRDDDINSIKVYEAEKKYNNELRKEKYLQDENKRLKNDISEFNEALNCMNNIFGSNHTSNSNTNRSNNIDTNNDNNENYTLGHNNVNNIKEFKLPSKTYIESILIENGQLMDTIIKYYESYVGSIGKLKKDLVKEDYVNMIKQIDENIKEREVKLKNNVNNKKETIKELKNIVNNIEI